MLFSFRFTILIFMAGFAGCAANGPFTEGRCEPSGDRHLASVDLDCGLELKKPNRAQAARLSQVIETIRNLPNEDKVHWSSQIVGVQASPGPAKLEMIVDQLLDPASPLLRELSAYNAELKSSHVNLWNIYMRLYDSLLIYSEGYKQIFYRASYVLPKSGVICDYGYGTGNGGALLVAMEPKRQIVGADLAQTGNTRAVEKMRQLSAKFGSPVAHLEVSDLFAYAPAAHSLDGALLNNVLYAIPEARRVELLKRIFSQLKTGARLVLNDPSAGVKANIRKFILDVAQSSLQSGSPLNEQEIAFAGFINIQFLIGPNHFLEMDELKGLAKEAGFLLRNTAVTYYGGANMLVLEKP